MMDDGWTTAPRGVRGDNRIPAKHPQTHPHWQGWVRVLVVRSSSGSAVPITIARVKTVGCVGYTPSLDTVFSA